MKAPHVPDNSSTILMVSTLMITIPRSVLDEEAEDCTNQEHVYIYIYIFSSND